MKKFEELSKEEQQKLLNEWTDEQDLTEDQKRFAKNLRSGASYDFNKDEYTPPD